MDRRGSQIERACVERNGKQTGAGTFEFCLAVAGSVSCFLFTFSRTAHTRARPMHSPDRLLAPDLPRANQKSIDVIPAPQFPARLRDPPTPTLSHLTCSTRRGHTAQLHGPHMFLAAVEPVRSDMVNRRSKPARLPAGSGSAHADHPPPLGRAPRARRPEFDRRDADLPLSAAFDPTPRQGWRTRPHPHATPGVYVTELAAFKCSIQSPGSLHCYLATAASTGKDRHSGPLHGIARADRSHAFQPPLRVPECPKPLQFVGPRRIRLPIPTPQIRPLRSRSRDRSIPHHTHPPHIYHTHTADVIEPPAAWQPPPPRATSRWTSAS